MTYEKAKQMLETCACSTAMRESINFAIEALEKQIPKKPPNQDRTVCPSCNSKARYGMPYEYFCPHCGQAIDWSDE